MMMVVVVFNVLLLSVRRLSSKYSRVMYTKQITDITPGSPQYCVQSWKTCMWIAIILSPIVFVSVNF